MSSATTTDASPSRAETLDGSSCADVEGVRRRSLGRRGETERTIGRGCPTPRAGIPDPTRPACATVVHAAAALYLGLGGQDLRGLLAMGFSLAEVSEWRGQSLGGLGRAVANALRRTGEHEAPTTAAVDQVLEVAEEGWSTWQAMVEQVIAAREPHGWRADAA
jgi:hypothetical protein